MASNSCLSDLRDCVLRPFIYCLSRDKAVSPKVPKAHFILQMFSESTWGTNRPDMTYLKQHPLLLLPSIFSYLTSLVFTAHITCWYHELFIFIRCLPLPPECELLEDREFGSFALYSACRMVFGKWQVLNKCGQTEFQPAGSSPGLSVRSKLDQTDFFYWRPPTSHHSQKIFRSTNYWTS